MDTLLPAYPDVFVEEEGIEDGFLRMDSVSVYVNPRTKRIIVLGSPQTHDREIMLEIDHNCDHMGCSMAHVLIRGTIETQGY